MVFERLQASLTLDTSGFERGVQDAKSDMDSLSQRGKDMGRSFQKAGGLMTAGLTVPLAMFGKQSIETASRIEEMQSKSETVFGDMTDEVRDWAEETAEATNRSKYQMETFATEMADTLKPMGFATEEAADMSMEMGVLAQDLASFNNMDPEEAFRRLQGGITGSHENLKKFGVIINQENLGQKLEEMFGVGTDAATEQQKAQARLQMVMEGTADAQGDAARTSDSYANQVRGLKADLEEMRLEIGQYLLPYAKILVSRLQVLATWFGNLSERQQKLILAIAGVLAVAGPLLLFIGTLLTMLPMAAAGAAILVGAIGALTLPILAVIAVLALLAAAWATDFMGIRGKTEEAVSFLRDKLGGLADYLRNDFPRSPEEARQNFNDNMERMKNGAVTAFEKLDELSGGRLSKWVDTVRENSQQAAVEFLTNLPTWADVKAAGRDMMEGFAEGIKEAASAPVDAVKGVAGRIGKFLPSSPAEMGELDDLDQRGPALVHELAQGMRRNTGEAESASSEVARAASPEPRAQVPPGGGGGEPSVVNKFDFSGIPDDAYIQIGALKEMLLQEQKDREEREIDQIIGGVMD